MTRHQPTPAALLATAGSALYGSRWQTDLASALGVNPRSMRRWVSGQLTPSPGVWRDLAELIRQRGEELDQVLDVVEGMGSGG